MSQKKAFALIHILLVFSFIIISVLVSIFVIKNYSLSKKYQKLLTSMKAFIGLLWLINLCAKLVLQTS